MLRTHLLTLVIVALFAAMPFNTAKAQELKITIENLSPDDGFFLTPLWVGLHDGSFDLFDLGQPASNALEQIAEEGDVGPLMTDFDMVAMRRQDVITSPGGISVAPVIDPGETASTTISINNAAAYRYFSFASMVIPSNDAFIGNEGATQYEVFDAAGNFNGDIVIDLTAADIWDAGTEENDAQGAAFSANGGTATDTIGGTVAAHPGLDNFLGTQTPTGFSTIGSLPGSSPFARITITQIPEPASFALVGLSLVGLGYVRRRQH